MAELVNKTDYSDALQTKLEALNRQQAADFQLLLGEPPDPKNVPDSFWDRVTKENEEEIAAALLLIFMSSYDNHRTWGGREPPADTERRDRVGAQWVAKRAASVAADFVTHSRDMVDTARRDWEIRTRRGEPIPQQDVRDLVTRVFGSQRMETIAVTETQVGMVEGGDAGVIHSRVSVTRYWGHSGRRRPGHCNAAVDPCPLCSPNEGLPEDQWQAGRRPGLCHPRDDCFMVYVDQDDFVIGTDNANLRPGNSPNKTWRYRP